MWVGAIHAESTDELPVTIVETRAFTSQAKGVLSEPEVAELKMKVAVNPQQGDVMPGTGGVRKLRWATGNRGKSGGARVIYYFHDSEMPIYLLAVYAKNEKINLTQRERNALKVLAKDLVKAHQQGRAD